MLHKFLPVCVFCGGVFMSASVSAGERETQPATGVGDYGSAVSDITDTRPLLELPHFNRDSGDLVFDLQGSVGLLGGGPRMEAENGFYVSPLSNYRAAAEQSYRSRAGDRRDVNAWDVGAVIGYQLSEPADHTPSGSINLQVVTDSEAPQGELLLQPGMDYVFPVSPSWQLNARVFSTYAPEERGRGGADGTSRQQGASAAEREQGWREVGVNVGLGYNVSESWNIQTQAGFTRSLGDPADRGAEKEEERTTDFFGGVFLNYQF